MQPLGAAPVETEPPEEDDPGNRVLRLGEAGAGQVVVDEALGAEPGEQALGDPLFQMQVHGVVAEHPGVLEDHRPDGRLAAPVGQLLVAPARRPQRLRRCRPRRVGSGPAIERREGPGHLPCRHSPAAAVAIVAESLRTQGRHRPAVPGRTEPAVYRPGLRGRPADQRRVHHRSEERAHRNPERTAATERWLSTGRAEEVRPKPSRAAGGRIPR